MVDDLKEIINKAWDNREILKDKDTKIAIKTIIDEIDMGKDGIYMRKGFHTGTFLPQVAQETNWTKEEFLGRCARDKANIGWDGWKDAELYVYEALVFSEDEFRDALK